MVLLYPNSRALLRCVCYSLVWSILDYQCSGSDCVHYKRAHHRNAGSVLTRSISTSIQPRQQTIALDSFDEDVSRNRHRRSTLPHDAGPSIAKHAPGSCHRLYRIQSSIRCLDDAGLFRRIATRPRRSSFGGRRFRIGALWRVVLPLVAPGLAATAVFCLIVSWNEFLFALVLTQTDAAMTLPVGIAGRVTQYEIKWGVMSAAGTVAIVPILAFALAVQKYLVRGLSLGAVKG